MLLGQTFMAGDFIGAGFDIWQSVTGTTRPRGSQLVPLLG
jgi:hypothetical protein